MLQKTACIYSGLPLHVITLDELGVDHTRFITDIAPTFDQSHGLLVDDVYDVVRRQKEFLARHGGSLSAMSPTDRKLFDQIMVARRRAFAVFDVDYQGMNAWNAVQVFPDAFTQDVTDTRSAPRVFATMSAFVTQHPEFQKLLGGVAGRIAEFEGREVSMRITVHQVQSMAYRTQPSDNAPEGTHQDGADYIISALIVEERGIRGAMSKVYWRDPDTKEQTTLLTHDLKVGEAILQADRGTPLWHDVTPMNLVEGSPYKVGTRSIFGFDIQLKK